MCESLIKRNNVIILNCIHIISRKLSNCEQYVSYCSVSTMNCMANVFICIIKYLQFLKLL